MGSTAAPTVENIYQNVLHILRKNSTLSNIAQRFQSSTPAEANVCAFCLTDELNVLFNATLSEVSRQAEQMSLTLLDLIKHLEIEKDELYIMVIQESKGNYFCNEDKEEDDEYDKEPKSKTGGKEYKDLLLDIDTAGNYLHVSEDLKTVSWSEENWNRPDWEVEMSKSSLDEAAKSKKKTLRNIYDKLSSKRGRAEEKIQSLKWHDKKINAKAIGITRRLNTMHIDMKDQLNVLFNDVLKEVSRQAEQMSLTLNLIKHLEIKKDELYSKMDHVGQLFNVSDPVMVIQESKGNDFCNEDEEEEDEYDKEPYVMGDLDESLISQTLHEGLSNVMKVAQEVKDWREYTDLLLDIDTAGNYLHVSEDLKTVSWSEENWNRPETPQRFQSFQVLSIKSFSSGRHLWEVEMSKSGGWAVGMCYPSIERKGDLSDIGDNSKSWGLWGFINKFFLRHDGKRIVISPQNGSCRRLRIDLDYEAGQLSFSERDDLVRHLHTFTANFTEPLHAAFWVRGNKDQKDCVVRIKRCKKIK
ncbi:E3 ubiquitin-protein ligase TRIM7-like [Bufo gargarizans]|uniref:E3 ubiquitin-protein ligase TRIM7-like n=1 Tax=Bufo gargarizans TaxID=30331 RepID=UPI001CF1DD33|nr:E3 ubiquitin-protein ligase TRIM7-like [Bufo gargarizans]